MEEEEDKKGRKRRKGGDNSTLEGSAGSPKKGEEVDEDGEGKRRKRRGKRGEDVEGTKDETATSPTEKEKEDNSGDEDGGKKKRRGRRKENEEDERSGDEETSERKKKKKNRDRSTEGEAEVPLQEPNIGAGLESPPINSPESGSPERKGLTQRLLATRRGFTQLNGEHNHNVSIGESVGNFFGSGALLFTSAGIKNLEVIAQEAEKKKIPIDNEKYGSRPVINVHVRDVSNLEEDLILRHPVVRVHFVDVTTGRYLAKSKNDSYAAHYFESSTASMLLYFNFILLYLFLF